MRPRNINVWPVSDIVGEPFDSVGGGVVMGGHGRSGETGWRPGLQRERCG